MKVVPTDADGVARIYREGGIGEGVAGGRRSSARPGTSLAVERSLSCCGAVRLLSSVDATATFRRHTLALTGGVCVGSNDQVEAHHMSEADAAGGTPLCRARAQSSRPRFFPLLDGLAYGRGTTAT